MRAPRPLPDLEKSPVKLHPFPALRPRPELAERVLTPPYDVVSTAEAREHAAGNARSFFHVIRPEIDLGDDVDIHAPEVYARGREALAGLVADGTLVAEAAPALFLYRLTQGEHVQTGFVGRASVADYRSGKVKRHELTRPAKEEDRLQLMLACEAHTGPVLLACRGNEALSAIVGRVSATPPEVSARAQDGVLHEVWPLRGAELAATEAAFEGVAAFYIADGHHRAASAARVGEALHAERGEGPWDAFLAVVFPDDELRILDYNRVVRDLNGMSPDEFLARVAERFVVGPFDGPSRPTGRHRFAMYLDGQWRELITRLGLVDDTDPIASLDVSILQDHVLGPILGIDDPRTDDRIDFVGGSRGTDVLAARVDAQKGGVAFAMWPTSLGELFAVADADQIMPPKSTWFEPKLASGLFVNSWRKG